MPPLPAYGRRPMNSQASSVISSRMDSISSTAAATSRSRSRAKASLRVKAVQFGLDPIRSTHAGEAVFGSGAVPLQMISTTLRRPGAQQ